MLIDIYWRDFKISLAFLSVSVFLSNNSNNNDFSNYANDYFVAILYKDLMFALLRNSLKHIALTVYIVNNSLCKKTF